MICGLISKVGLITLIKKGYTALGNIALFTIIIPIFISIPRMIRQDKVNREAAASGKDD